MPCDRSSLSAGYEQHRSRRDGPAPEYDGDEISLGELLEGLDCRDVCDQDDRRSLSDFHI